MANTRAKDVLTVGILSGSKAASFVSELVKSLAISEKNGTVDSFVVGAVTGANMETFKGQAWSAHPVSMGVAGLTKCIPSLSIDKSVQACEIVDISFGTFDTAESAIALLQKYNAIEIEAFLTGMRAVDAAKFTSLTTYASSRVNSTLTWKKV